VVRFLWPCLYGFQGAKPPPLIVYLVLDRKLRKKDFQFYSGNFNKLILLDFLNPKSAIKNPKSCLNGLFVQALYKRIGLIKELKS